MPTFKYHSKGNSDKDWNPGTIEAADKKEALQKLDELFGVERDEKGKQTNSDLVEVELL